MLICIRKTNPKEAPPTGNHYLTFTGENEPRQLLFKGFDMKFFLILAAVSHLSIHVHGAEIEEPRATNSAQRFIEDFANKMHSLLEECQKRSFTLSEMLMALLDPTQYYDWPELYATYQTESTALQQKMNETSFGGHPLLGTTWQFGQPHSCAQLDVVTDVGFWRFIKPKEGDNEEEISQEIKQKFGCVVRQVQALLKDDNGKPTFFAFGEDQSIGFAVSPGYGISATWPKYDLPSFSDSSKTQDCYDQLNRIRASISYAICSLALLGEVCDLKCKPGN